MHVLITGGCGFIGSHAVRHFYHAHPDAVIFNLDLLTYAGNRDNLMDIEAGERRRDIADRRYHFIHGSITNSQLLDALFQEYQFDMVINFAAETHVDRSIMNMTDFINTNIGGVRCLIEAVRTHKVPRFIHISTDEVYGSVLEGESTEDACLRPSNPYSSSKAAADLIALSFMHTHNLPGIIVRGSNNYGPFQYPEKLIPLAISNLIEGKKVPVHGTGLHIRSWLHVMDFCEAIDLIAHRGQLREVYNVSAEERTNIEVIDMLVEYLKADVANSREHVSDRPGADLRYAPDSSKLRKTLGWTPKRSLEKDLKDVVEWYLANQPWWKKIKEKKEFQDHYQKQATGQWY